MNCGILENHLEDYLEDRIDESLRTEIRTHLYQCADCRTLSKTHPSTAVDFKKLNEIALPPAIETAVQKKLQPEWQKSEPRTAFTWGLLIPAAAVFLALSFFAVSSLPRLRAWAENSGLKPEVIEGAEPEALRQLKTIAERLGIKDFSGENSGNAPRQALQKSVSLKPLHMHLLFNDEEAKQAFARGFDAMASDVSFRSPDFRVVSLNYEQLKALLDQIQARKIRTENLVIADSSMYPEFEGVVRVSLFLEVPSEPSTLALAQHWHLGFHIPNRYTLLDKLQELNVKLTYQTVELWVFDVPGSELKKMMETINVFPAVKADYGREAVLPDAASVKVQVVISLKDL